MVGLLGEVDMIWGDRAASDGLRLIETYILSRDKRETCFTNVECNSNERLFFFLLNDRSE